MTTEEKAKAYDEALEQARFYHGNCPSEPEKNKLEEIFPQLHESEDEQTRKRLIDFISNIKAISESGRSSWAVRKDDAKYVVWYTWKDSADTSDSSMYYTVHYIEEV